MDSPEPLQLLLWAPIPGHAFHRVGAIRFPHDARRSRWPEQWAVSSCTFPGLFWRVSRDPRGAWACSCPAWIHTFPRRPCAHILDVTARVGP